MAVPARRASDMFQPWRDPVGSPPRRPPVRAVPARPRPRSRRRRVAFLLLATTLVAGLLLTLTSVQALLAQGAFRLSSLGLQAKQLERESDLLRLRLARLSSPERVAAAARQAGLVRPERVELLAPR